MNTSHACDYVNTSCEYEYDDECDDDARRVGE